MLYLCVCLWLGFSAFPALLSIINSRNNNGGSRVILLNDFYCIQFSFPARPKETETETKTKQTKINIALLFLAQTAGTGWSPRRISKNYRKNIYSHFFGGVRGGSVDRNKEHFWLFNNEGNQSILMGKSHYLSAHINLRARNHKNIILFKSVYHFKSHYKV